MTVCLSVLLLGILIQFTITWHIHVIVETLQCELVEVKSKHRGNQTEVKRESENLKEKRFVGNSNSTFIALNLH